MKNKIIKKIIGKLGYHNLTAVRIIDYFFPKDENLFLLGAFHSKYLKDNAYYFYDYLSKEHKEINFVMLISNPDARKNIEKLYENIRVYDPFSLRGFYHALKAKVLILIANLSTEIETSFFFSRRKVVVNFWHGIPLKGVCLTDSEWDARQRKYYQLRESARYDIFTASSKLERMINAASFGVSYSKIPITGSPRNDYLYHYLNGNIQGKRVLDFFPALDYEPEKILLYAPTKRESGAPILFPFADLDLGALDRFFVENRLLMVLRGHFSNVTNETYGILDFKEYENFRTIVDLNIDKVDNVNDILWDIDILITDYSGIYWDFLLLNRPIIFFPYDIDEYKRSPGIQFSYELITAGPKINNQKEFILKIKDYLNDPYIDSGKRVFIRDLMHEHFDGKACDRILFEIKKQIRRSRA